jgi:inosine-uridine nucleoside N-ribohydrolase
MKNLRKNAARVVVRAGLSLTLLAACAASSRAAGPAARPGDRPGSIAPAAKIPVILDTDIGDDIDDTWALAMLLKSPQFDLKLVTTTRGKAEYRAKLIAKILTVAKRSDVAIGLGAGGREGSGGQQPWVKDYNLAGYKGTVHADGVGALIAAIEAAPQPITLISIGPSDTVAAALERKPGIAAKAFFVGMQGAVRKGYDGSGKVIAEYNVKANVPAAKKVLAAAWRKTTITPLDTCGLVNLSGRRFQALKESNDPLVMALLENYRIWANNEKVAASSILFDTVAVYLAYPQPRGTRYSGSLLVMEDLSIAVTDEGITAIDPAGAKMSVATAWKDLDGYRDLLVKVLLSK